jgi:hypothetical protein
MEKFFIDSISYLDFTYFIFYPGLSQHGYRFGIQEADLPKNSEGRFSDPNSTIILDIIL